MRQNRVYWFKGAISRARFTPRALAPREFMSKRLNGGADASSTSREDGEKMANETQNEGGNTNVMAGCGWQHVNWATVPVERPSEGIERQMVVGQ